MNKELFYSELSKDLKKKFGTSVEKALLGSSTKACRLLLWSLLTAIGRTAERLTLTAAEPAISLWSSLWAEPFITILLCLGITDEVDELLKAHGRSLNDLEEIEDAASATVVLADLPLASSIPPPLMTCLWTATE